MKFRPGFILFSLFCLLLLVYESNGDFLDVRDTEANIYFPISLLREGDMAFTPSEMPFMFQWQLRTPKRSAEGTFPSLDVDVDGVSARELYARGALRVVTPNYYIVPTRQKDARGEPLFINTFGPGPGLCAFPIFVTASATGMNFVVQSFALWQLAKFVGVLLTIGSALFLFQTMRRFPSIGIRSALCITLAYALGTGAWSVSSQALWQQSANTFFLMLGLYLWVRTCQTSGREELICAAGAALALGYAMSCRPTSLAPALILGIALFKSSRRAGSVYCLAILAPLLAIGAYNFYYLDSPWTFGQAEAARQIALEKTGSPAIWQTPLWLGAAGLLFSPARGLFVFSPFLVFSVLGIARLRDERWKILRPLPIAFLPMLLAQFKHYDWWGGWSYGCRPLLDIMPLLCLLLIPAWSWLRARRIRMAVFSVLLGWSALVQFTGAFAYDTSSWNNRLESCELLLPGQPIPITVRDENELRTLVSQQKAKIIRETRLDVDLSQNRWRLWSLTDNQISYCLTHFATERAAKRARLTTTYK